LFLRVFFFFVVVLAKETSEMVLNRALLRCLKLVLRAIVDLEAASCMSFFSEGAPPV